MLELLDFLPNADLPRLLADAAVTETVAQASAGADSDVERLFSVQGIFTLGMLILLQAVLGFDNLLYISIESKRVPEDQQSMVRRLGIGLAIAFRIGLLFLVVNLIEWVEDPFHSITSDFISAEISASPLF